MSTDDDLLRRAKLGDPEAWRELYRAHAGRLVVWLRSRPTGDVAVSPEDLAAEAWLVAARRLPEFVGDSGEFAGWLFGIARHLTQNAQRRSQRRATEPVAAFDDDVRCRDAWSRVPHPGTSGPDWVETMLRKLPPRERDVVALIDVLGLDVEGAARALAISQVAVRVAHHRGLRRLRAAGQITDSDGVTQLAT